MDSHPRAILLCYHDYAPESPPFNQSTKPLLSGQVHFLQSTLVKIRNLLQIPSMTLLPEFAHLARIQMFLWSMSLVPTRLACGKLVDAPRSSTMIDASLEDYRTVNFCSSFSLG